MSTRSDIAMQQENGTYQSIYCHFDGYPTHNGKLLLEHWTNPVKIKQLMELGDLSGLGEELGNETQSWKSPNPKWCLAYARDRGETDCDSMTYPDLGTLLENSNNDFLYVFSDNKWYFRGSHKSGILTELLTMDCYEEDKCCNPNGCYGGCKG